MTLGEVMEKASPSDIYHIGAKSNFFFIGTKDEFFRDIGTIEKKYTAAVKKMIRLFDKGARNSPTIAANKEKLLTLKKHLKQPPFRKRTVRDQYERFQGDGHIILVDGEGAGNYWYRSEYVDWRRNNGRG